MKLKKRLLTISLAAALALTLVACGNSSDQTPGSSTPGSTQPAGDGGSG